MDEKAMTLPLGVTSQADIGRLMREVDALDDFMHQAAIRTPGSSLKLPKSSRLLDEITNNNQLNMLHEQDRTRLKAFLTAVRAKAPVLHMSFSADPSSLFMQKLMTYLRREIHPIVLVHTGLQPMLGAGCIVRTGNKYFDFSLRQRFASSRNLLLEKIHADAPESPQPAATQGAGQ